MIKVYIASIEMLEDNKIFERELQKVSEERKKKVNHCKMLEDKKRSLLAGILLQYAWENFCLLKHREEEDLQISYGENEKPQCINAPDFFFNLSHSGKYVVCAIAEEAIGIDIQQIKESRINTAKRFFAKFEWEQIEQESLKEQQALFSKLWAMKESYIKYTGLGMKQGLNTFCINHKTGVVSDRNDHIVAFSYARNNIKGYYTAVCSKEKNAEITYQNVQYLHENA